MEAGRTKKNKSLCKKVDEINKTYRRRKVKEEEEEKNWKIKILWEIKIRKFWAKIMWIKTQMENYEK